MSTDFSQRAFHSAIEIWQEWSGKQVEPRENVVPFCTPIIPNPDVVIVGLNHARFDDKRDSAWAKNDRDVIAEEFAKAAPLVNTFSMHGHQYARNLRATIELSTGRIFPKKDQLTRFLFKSWVGTNRCAVQCHQRGEQEVRQRIKHDEAFSESQKKMDGFLRDTISSMVPKYVLLSGRFAIDLFKEAFEDQSGSTVEQMMPVTLGEVTLVPMLHFSHNQFMAANSIKLKKIADDLGWSDL